MRTVEGKLNQNAYSMMLAALLTTILLSLGLMCTGCDDDDNPTGPKTPTVTPTSVPSPTPTPLAGGMMRVRVEGIPEMSNENKDSINKQALFCLQSGRDELGIYHRYMQPNWPDGNWWPCYKLEYFRNGDQVEDVDKPDWEELPDGKATFLIDFTHPTLIVVHCEENDTSESISESHPAEFHLSENCMGNDSPATAIRIE